MVHRNSPAIDTFFTAAEGEVQSLLLPVSSLVVCRRASQNKIYKKNQQEQAVHGSKLTKNARERTNRNKINRHTEIANKKH